jgi:flagellar export protein FliJ
MKRLQALQAEYSGRLRDAQDRAQAMSQSVSYRNFLSQIGTLIERTSKDLGAAEAVLSAARRDLQRCEREQNKYEALIEREDVKSLHELERSEQKALEELALSRFIQQQRAG